MERLKELRTRKGYSQQELADLAEVAQHTVSEIELGRRKPHGRTLRKLAAVLGVGVEELVEGPKEQAQRPDTEDAALAVLFRGLAQRGEKIVEQSVKEGASEQLAEQLREYHREAAALHRITGGRDILGKRSEEFHEAQDAYEEVEGRIQAMLAQDVAGVGEEVRTRRLRSKEGAKDARTEAS